MMPDPAKLLHHRSRVRLCFNRSTRGYREHALVQRQIARQLIDTFGATQGIARRRWPVVLETGCGSNDLGKPLSQLNRYHKIDRYLNLDLAERQLRQLRQNHLDGARAIGNGYIHADLTQLPLSAASVDLYLSTMALHWCLDPRMALGEMERVLKPSGIAALAIPIVPTMRDLRQRLQRLGAKGLLNSFLPIENWLKRFDLTIVRSEQQHYTLHCPGMDEAFAHIKGVGANHLWRNVHSATDTDPDRNKPLKRIADWRRWRQDRLWTQAVDIRYHIAFFILQK